MIWHCLSTVYRCPGYSVMFSATSAGEFSMQFVSLLYTQQYHAVRAVAQPRSRSVVKYGGQGQSGQAIKLFQAPRKISFAFHFWHVFHPWWCETCSVIQQQFWMKERDILRGEGVKTYHSYIFSWDQDSQPPGYTPLSQSRELHGDTHSPPSPQSSRHCW